jgi:hypothetical protein
MFMLNFLAKLYQKHFLLNYFCLYPSNNYNNNNISKYKANNNNKLNNNQKKITVKNKEI